jgi:hypothetical protein
VEQPQSGPQRSRARRFSGAAQRTLTARTALRQSRQEGKAVHRFIPLLSPTIKSEFPILSQNSATSEWVETEVEFAFERERKEGGNVLFPIRLDNWVMKTDKAWVAKIRLTRHIGDFSEWKNHDSYQKGFARLLRDLKAEDKADKKENV